MTELGTRSQGTPAEDRFRALFSRHYPAVYGYAARRVGRDEAGDVAGEVFTVAWRRVAGIPHGAEELPWLYGVARNVVSNTRRSRRRRERLDAQLARQESAAAPFVDTDDEVLDAVATLSARDREVLALAAWEGLEPRELGLVLGCSPNAASVRLHRARRRLTRALDGGTP